VDEYRIANFKPIDNFTKSVSSRQDKISEDKNEMRGKFEGFLLIPKEDYKCIQPGTYIRYLKDGNLYRSGGLLKLNRWPKYWVLESTDGKKIRWSLPLEKTKNVYYKRDIEEARKTKKNKNKLYNAVMSHDYVVISKEEFEKLNKKALEADAPTDSSYYESETDDSSVVVDITLQKRHK
jgi:hypothetical protein